MKIQQAMLRRLAKKGKKQNGFTLIELMVVVAIVGVLSAVGLPQLLKAQDRAKVSVARQGENEGTERQRGSRRGLQTE